VIDGGPGAVVSGSDSLSSLFDRQPKSAGKSIRPSASLSSPSSHSGGKSAVVVAVQATEALSHGGKRTL
jgi:hypothetical protein